MSEFEHREPIEATDIIRPAAAGEMPFPSDTSDGVTSDSDANTPPDIDDSAFIDDEPVTPTDSAEPIRVLTPAERVAATIKEVREDPDRRRHSSSDSVALSSDGPRDYTHELWMPDKSIPGEEKPGLLRCVAYLDDNGNTTGMGNSMDRYHYRTASGAVTCAQEGLAPVMSAAGINTACTVRDVYWDKRCNIDISFHSSVETVELGNAILAASGESLRFTLFPPGMYSAGDFIEQFAEGRYPISQERTTGQKESPYLEHGSHDIIQHVPAILAMAGTRALKIVQRRAQDIASGEASHQLNMHGHANKEVIRGWFMRDVDGTMNVNTFADLLRGDPRAAYKVRSLLNLRGGESAQPYIDEILENLRTPLESGRLVLPPQTDHS